MIKRLTLFIGIALILVSLFTVIPNTLIGKNGLFVTNFSYNFINLFVGVLFVCIYVFDFRKLLSVYRYIGYTFIVLAVLGAWVTGFDEGSVLGIIYTNGVGHIFNSVFGIACIVIATNESRTDSNEAKDEHHFDNH